jgi:SPW repeat
MMKQRKESILDIYNLVLGALLFASPWLFASTHAVMGEDAWVTSILIVSLSVAALMAFAEWEEWIILLLGIWLVVSPWILGFHHITAMKINVGVGLAVAYLAGLELWLLHYSAPPTMESR